MIIRLLLMVCFLTNALIAGAADSTAKTLIVGSEEDFHPFAIGRTDETADGFTVDLWKEVAKEAGLKYVIRVRPWGQILQEFKDGTVDILINIAQSDERHEYTDFSVPLVTAHGAIFTRVNESVISSEADFVGKTIIVFKSDLAHEYAVSKGWHKQLVIVDTAKEGLKLLASGKHDAMLLSRLAGIQILRELNIKNIKVLDGKAGYAQKFSIGVHTGDSELLARVNEGLALVKASGAYDAIYNKWFGVYEVKKTTLRDVLKYIVPVTTLFLICGGYFFRKRMIERSTSEKELRESEAKFRSLAESSQDYIMRYDRECRHTYMNSAGLKASGMTESNVFGKTHRESGYPEELSLSWEKKIRNVFDTAEPHQFEFEWERSAGIVVLDWRLTPECAENGMVISVLGVSRDITNRTRMEQELLLAHAELERQVEERTVEVSALAHELRIILHTLPIGACVLKDRKIHFANPALDVILGYEIGTTIGMNTSVFYPDSKTFESTGEEAYRVIAEGKTHPIELMMKKKDGSPVYCSIFGQAIDSEIPEAGSIWMIQNITDRKRSEEALFDSEEKFRALFECAKDGIFLMTCQGTIESVNPAFAQTHGYSTQEMYRMKIQELDTPETTCLTPERMQKVLSGEPLTFEVEQYHRDGHTLSLEVSANLLTSRGEQLILAVHRDISDRKRVEQQLRKSERHYQSLVETSQDVIWKCDTEGRFTYLNQAVEQVFGYELGEMLGKKFTEFQSIDNAAQCMKELLRLMRGECIGEFESTFIGKSTNEIILVIKAIYKMDDNGAIIGATGTANDITQRCKTVQELHLATTAAESANRAKSDFLAVMSHEIRTPMNGVIGMIQLLLHTELTPEQNECAESAINSGFDLVRLLNDILDLSKIESDKIELETTSFDLRTEISEVIKLLSLSARKRVLSLTWEIDAEVPTALHGDAGRLRQIVNNLVCNSLKFTPQGSVKLLIRKDSEDENAVTLRFLVQDSGIGIAADQLEQIFKPFTQADSSTTRRYGGTGLGLTICKQLAELMGGRIGAESSEGIGSTFWFTVVMTKQSRGIEILPVRRDLQCELKWNKSSIPIRILLTEDDPVAQKIIPRLLKSYGYLVDVAGDGTEALQALKMHEYALVLMDCMMPEMNGYDVTAAIRDPASPVLRHDIPVIALTGNASKQDRDRCIAAGMDDHLSKPLILADLLVKLDMWLSGEQWPRGIFERCSSRKDLRK